MRVARLYTLLGWTLYKIFLDVVKALVLLASRMGVQRLTYMGNISERPQRPPPVEGYACAREKKVVVVVV